MFRSVVLSCSHTDRGWGGPEGPNYPGPKKLMIGISSADITWEAPDMSGACFRGSRRLLSIWTRGTTRKTNTDLCSLGKKIKRKLSIDFL